MYLDVREYLGDWRAGVVVAVIEKHNMLHIQFDGCPTKMDEVNALHHPFLTMQMLIHICI